MNISDDASNVGPIFQQMKKNFQTLKTRNVQFRKDALRSLMNGYKEMIPKIDQALKKDIGSNAFMNNLLSHTATINDIKEALSELDKWVKPKSVTTPLAAGLGSSYIQNQPLGVVLIISAWNYPIVTGFGPLVPAIAAGNSVILKPSQLAPYTSNVIKQLFDKYLDPMFYQVIQGKVEVGKYLTKLPFDLICFTGSTVTGRFVAIEAAKNLVPCILELGGKCPIIVDETAKVEAAVPRILFGKFTNCGQTCIGVDHVYVHESVFEKFKTALMGKINEMYGSENLSDEGFYGKIINQGHVKRLQGYLNDKHGGKILYGGTVNKDKCYISPTIIQSPSQNSLMMKEQIFGPILPIMSYTNLNDLIRNINSKPKPLSVYLFSENSSNVKLVRHSTSSGSFVVNDTVMQKSNSQLPFGGVGGSGYGRYHGKAGFESFSNPKSILMVKAMNSFPNSQRFMPYTEKRMKNMNLLLKVGNITTYQVGKCCLILFVLILALIAAGITMDMFV